MSSPANPNYTCPESLVLTSLIQHIDEKHEEIQKYKPLREDIWSTIQNKVMVDWTHHSNAIEGSTLSRGETGFFLQYGLTVKGKPLKDFLDARNHADAIEFLFEIIKNEREITPYILKEFNALLLSGVNYTEAVDSFGQKVKKKAHPGQFKKQPNHVHQIDGSIHYYVDPTQVPSEIETLCSWITEQEGKLHPAVIAAIAHYNMVRIHPFDDGNGRGSRLLMNLIVMKKGYAPIVVKSENRQDYIEGLMAADKGDMMPFITFIMQSLSDTQEIILCELRKSG